MNLRTLSADELKTLKSRILSELQARRRLERAA